MGGQHADSDQSLLGDAQGNDAALRSAQLATPTPLVAALTTQVSAAEGNITTLQGQASTLEGQMATAQGDITALDGRLDTAESNISALQGLVLWKRVAVPATATSTGAVGDMAADASYLYICYATNTWRRVAIATW